MGFIRMCRVTVPKGIIVLYISLNTKTDAFGITDLVTLKHNLNFLKTVKYFLKKMSFMFGSNYEIVLKKL